MIFGDENKNKKFKFVEKINGLKVYGRGYVARGGEIAREFFSPLVPDNFNFIDEFINIGKKLGCGSVSNELKVELSNKISEHLEKEKEALVEIDNDLGAETELLDELSNKFNS